MDELNNQHQPIPTPRLQRKKGIAVFFLNAFWISYAAIFINWDHFKWILPISCLMTIAAAVYAGKAYPFLFHIKAAAVLGNLIWIALLGWCFVAIVFMIPMNYVTRSWISVSAQIGLLLTVVLTVRACWLQHKRVEKRRYRSINFKTMEYDFMRDSFSEEPIDFVVLSSSPLYRLMFFFILALSGGPALVIIANKFSEFMFYSIGAIAAWTAQLLFLAFILPILVDAYVIYKLEKKHGKPLRIVVPDRKRKPA